jgi:hypothetical protein
VTAKRNSRQGPAGRADLDGYPNGLLMWGQPGTYNAINDRQVITALSDGNKGVVKPVLCRAETGLTFSVGPGWLAVIPAEDGTSAIAGSNQTLTLGPEQGVMAGPVTGAREDLLWCDTYPDSDARWRLSVIRAEDQLGRPGVMLARISVPQGANLASQFSFSRQVPTFGAHANSERMQVQTSAWTEITPRYYLVPTMIRPRAHFRLEGYGQGRFANPVRHVGFRIWEAGPWLWLNVAGLGWTPGITFSWWAEGIIQVSWDRNVYSMTVRASVQPWSGPGGGVPAWNAVSGVRMAHLIQWNPDNVVQPHHLRIQAAFDQTISGQYLQCESSVFETFPPYENPLEAHTGALAAAPGDAYEYGGLPT